MSLLVSSASFTREEVAKFWSDLNHELRNHLNLISLEAMDLADQAGPQLDSTRMQAQIQKTALYLKQLRDAFAPGEPQRSLVSVSELLAQVKESSSFEGLSLAHWPEATAFPGIVELDSRQVVEALTEIMRDVALLADQGSGIGVFVTEIAPRHFAYQVAFTPRQVPARPETWGQSFSVKDSPEQLQRYRLHQLLALNGGSVAWSYEAPYLHVTAQFRGV